MKKVTILFFATFREKTGTRKIDLEIPDASLVSDLKDILQAKFTGLEGFSGSMLVSINKEFASDDMEIPNEAEIAIFPPVSGGEKEILTICNITEEVLDLNALLEMITTPSTGAAVIFTGMVRGTTQRCDPHETLYMEYEAYIPMAQEKMYQVADEIRAKWTTVEGIVIVQRIGKLYPLTPTVVIACTAAHRDTGVFEAARYGIDRLKEIIPIWKKEYGPAGEEWVEGDYKPV